MKSYTNSGIKFKVIVKTVIVLSVICFSCKFQPEEVSLIKVPKNTLFEGDTTSQKIFDETKKILKVYDFEKCLDSDSVRFWMFGGESDSTFLISIGSMEGLPLIRLYSIQFKFDKNYIVTGLNYAVKTYFPVSSLETFKSKLDSIRTFQAGYFRNLKGYDMCPGGGSFTVEYLFGGKYNAYNYQCFYYNYKKNEQLEFLNKSFHYFKELLEKAHEESRPMDDQKTKPAN
jgi:hypothetical protein